MRSRLLLVLAVMVMALVLPAAAVASDGGQLGWSPASSSLVTASAGAHTSSARPVITKLSLSAAKPGARLTISGRGFGARRGKGSVLFGAFKSTKYIRWSARKIVCKVPVIPAAKLTIKVRTAKRPPIPLDILLRDLERIRTALDANDMEAALQTSQLIVAPAAVPSVPWPVD